MNSDPDQYLHQLVVAALTVFVVVSLLLAAFVAREVWLQQRIVGLSSSLQVSLEELEETTEEIQSKMSEMDVTAQNTPESAGINSEWDSVNELLEDVDQQLGAIEEDMDEVAIISEEQIDIISAAENEEVKTPGSIRTQADQVFTIFAVLTGISAIAIALLLGMAMRVQDNRLVV